MDMKEWVAREQVRALLHIAETPGESVEVSAETLAALCRTQLAVWDGPLFAIDVSSLTPGGDEIIEAVPITEADGQKLRAMNYVRGRFVPEGA